MLTITAFRQEVKQEFQRILTYWETFAVRPSDGFYGRVDYANKPDPQADLSIVLLARILWSFSMAYRTTKNPAYLTLATRAYTYLKNHFWDATYGGVYWTVKADGSPDITKKQLYGQGFALYGLSEYYRATENPQALTDVKTLFKTMITHAYDPVHGGFTEAFNQDWAQTDDYILSKGDHRKSMNTHLHLIEPFTNVLRIWPDTEVRSHVKKMLEHDFMEHIIDPKKARMRLFFTDDWQVRSTEVSYGHDIEASWLLYETAEVLNDRALLARTRDLSLKMANATLEGLNPDGALTYEWNPETKHKNQERSWWVLSEQMVGFYNAYQLSGKRHFLDKSMKSWEFIKSYLIDSKGGEWFNHTNAEHQPSLKSDKINAWKCPYHNSRACYEIWHRTEKK